MTSNDQVALSVWLIALAAVVVLAAVFYLVFAAARFYEAITRVTKITGSVPGPSLVDGISSAFGVDLANVSGLSIKGPGSIETGQPTTYSLIRADETPGPSARWAVVPPNKADLSATEGQSIVVTAKTPGDFEVTATWTDTVAGTPTTSVVRTSVTARKAAERASTIPLIARGFITVILVPLLLAIAGVLALTDRLSSAAAAVLSAALGFLFGRHTDSSNQSSQDQSGS